MKFLGVPIVKSEGLEGIGFNILLFILSFAMAVILGLIITGNFQPTDGSRPSVELTLSLMGLGVVAQHLTKYFSNKWITNLFYGPVSTAVSIILVIVSFFVIRQF